MAKATYKDAGVDLETYEESMSRLPRLMQRTHTPRVVPLKQGFAGLFKLDFPAGPFARNYREPLLVSGTDGVGTKLKVASRINRHDSVGIDLVAMCVNDVICCGAEPLFFLDYVAMSKDDPELLEQIVTGISEGCAQADCALLGGETAIMPDLYQPGEYDLAGFCVGVVEKDRVLDGSKISAGHQLIGVASNGFHSNGYSLIRKVVFDMAQLQIDDIPDALEGKSVGEQLIQPTRIYARLVQHMLTEFESISGIAHITGGGLHENIERILPDGLAIDVDHDSWEVPAEFRWLQELGDIEEDELRRVFNCGIGLVFVVPDQIVDDVQSALADRNERVFRIGRVVSS